MNTLGRAFKEMKLGNLTDRIKLTIDRQKRWAAKILSRHGLRYVLAKKFLRGDGIEIGALHNPLRVSKKARVKYLDRMDTPSLYEHYPQIVKREMMHVEIVDDGEILETIADGTLDFLIANHFLEHTQDPIKTIKRHLEVLTPGGVLYYAVPDKRWTFDKLRPVTTLEHLYQDYEEGPSWSYMDHVREYVELVEEQELIPQTHVRGVERILEEDYSIHFHVWTQRELLELLVDIRSRLALPFDILAFVLNRRQAEVICVLQRRGEENAE